MAMTLMTVSRPHAMQVQVGACPIGLRGRGEGDCGKRMCRFAMWSFNACIADLLPLSFLCVCLFPVREVGYGMLVETRRRRIRLMLGCLCLGWV